MKRLITRFAADRSGATAIEYGLIAGGIFVAIVAIVADVGSAVEAPFNDARAGLQ